MLPPPPRWSICKARASVHPLVPSSLCQRQSGLLQRPPSFAMISQRNSRCRIVLLLSAMCISHTPSCRASLKTYRGCAKPRFTARSDTRRYATHYTNLRLNKETILAMVGTEPQARMAKVTSKDQVSRELQLRSFDQATERHRRRPSARATGRPRKRGWSREDLYRRGVIDARGQG